MERSGHSHLRDPGKIPVPSSSNEQGLGHRVQMGKHPDGITCGECVGVRGSRLNPFYTELELTDSAAIVCGRKLKGIVL